MNSSEEQMGSGVPPAGGASAAEASPGSRVQPAEPVESYDDGYPHEPAVEEPVPASVKPEPPPSKEIATVRRAGGGGRKPPPPPPSGGDGGDEEDGMLRMSFLEHLEELRSRIIRALIGVGVAFVVSLIYTDKLWAFVCQPAAAALKALGYEQELVQISPMEGFNVIWVKLPILCAIFLASPWILYQVWAFISPGLYRRERRWAAPFVIGSASLFIIGGLFAYFIAFRFGLTFLLGIGRGNYVKPMVSITEYFDLFVNVTLGVGLVFELPVIIFFLTLLRIVTPSFLLNHSRYAILAIFIIAAIVTPTPDVFNLMLFATPMCLLFYVGIFAGYLLVLHRENRRFPWKKAITIIIIVLLLLALVLYLAITKYGVKVVPHWPFFVH
ncbi:MAG TPA: twin-arginine translocase subunit TatC [Candidatus Acidoferrales bacterium]|nr:twin-arginine translocase subunit TatC [Candidatus Acidoferrales bacterium]